jgi:adenylylsulfate kinase-like enzyme
MVIWMTGLSGSGKSTVADAIVAMLKPRMPELVLVDGDVIRELFGQSLDYSEASRVIQVKRLRTLAKFLSAQGQVALVTVLYSHPELLAWNRANIPQYFEVYMDTPLRVVQDRDVKGLYRKAARGEMPNVVGLDIPWYPPTNPDLHLKGDCGETPEDFARRIIAACPKLAPLS